MRPLSLFLGLSLLTASGGLLARQIDAEDVRRLNDRISSHEEALDTHRIALQELRTEIARLRAENDRLKSQAAAPRNYATQDQITKLADQLREVEKNRTADKQQILDALDKIKSMPPVVVPAPEPRNKPAGGNTGGSRTAPKEPGGDGGAAPAGNKPNSPAADEFSEYFEHTIAEGETLSAVIDAYNKQHGLKTRLSHVLKANPSIKDPRRIRLNQKIRIPAVR